MRELTIKSATTFVVGPGATIAAVTVLIAAALLVSTIAISTWMVRLLRRDYREAHAAPSHRRKALAVQNLERARLTGFLFVVPILLAAIWIDPPALTRVATVYLVVVIAVCLVLLRRSRTSLSRDGEP